VPRGSSITIANAFVTGVFAIVEDRFRSRVIWLLPLLAGLFVLEWLDYRQVEFALRERKQSTGSRV
jgi:hypothetical protein